MSEVPLNTKGSRATPYLSALGAWALAFGCAVGWGSFVMPGNTFLGNAGPLGTAIAMAVAALIMIVVIAGLTGLGYRKVMKLAGK